MLEGIKIYLNIPSCIFVLGINQREIERAVASHLPSDKKDEDRAGDVNPRAQEYVEKICNFVWKLPILSPLQQAAMVEKWLEPVTPKTLCDQICDVIQTYEVLPANPRKIKAFCNAVLQIIRYRERHLNVQELITGDRARAIVLAACFYQFHPKLIRFLQTYPNFFASLKVAARTGFEGDQDKYEEYGALKATRIYSQGNDDSSELIFIDPADGSFFRCQKLLVEGGLLRNDIAPFLGMTIV